MQLIHNNTTAELVRVTVEFLGYANVTEETEFDDSTWGGIKREWLPPKPKHIVGCISNDTTSQLNY